MDSAAAKVLGQPLPFSSTCYYAAAPSSKSAVAVSRRAPSIGILSSGFCDQSHMQYYNSKNGRSSLSPPAAADTAAAAAAMSGKEATKDNKAPKKMMKKKKQLKLLKELSRDLSTFSQIGFGLDSNGVLVDQVERDAMKEAADVLMEMLQKLRAQEKELKRKAKEEKARLKAATSRPLMDCEMSSGSSSSSESSSSDEECGEVINMKNQKQVDKSTLQQPNMIESKAASPALQPGCSSPAITNLQSATFPEPNPKIEVCMGGKCKKSGGALLLEEFQKAMGIEGAVSGCKCMGKCRDGPNVKVLNNAPSNSNSNSLCIGVGIEDVEMIVANFLEGKGQNHSHTHLGFAAVAT
ncbi:diacylglycerol O-acyltransferase 3 [Andrographis paniculata]|uniref:diacylglycerol O-acyltransferase 3 n=1 Tax=Andrographis paniculata TaxID=175694 RepID=UPI0021E7EB6A|nr:diacylglycerol O-acyltransferase 3 [Andrographis paniculata]XP_051134942.1 diacylglycerol O-acyltransferase 3 [Andrographis paniculata]